MRRSVGSWITRLIGRTLEVGLGNPYALVQFVPRCLRASGLWAKDLFSRRAGTVIGPILTETSRSFFRGIWVALALGVALAAGLRAAGQAVGPLIEPIAEGAAAKILVVDGIPLLLAVFLSARIGATLAAQLGPLPAIRGLPAMKIRNAEIREMILPTLTAGPIVGAASYFLVLLVAAAGYRAVGPLPQAVFSAEWGVPPHWRLGLETGLAKSAVFGFVVAYVGAALGVQAAEAYRRDQPETTGVHRAVWESAVLGVIVCLVVTMFWSSLE
jgi:ABC-type transporter Mla maintaining outer membrane lipid asymmetry permease subunit MlaE